MFIIFVHFTLTPTIKLSGKKVRKGVKIGRLYASKCQIKLNNEYIFLYKVNQRKKLTKKNLINNKLHLIILFPLNSCSRDKY